MDRTPNSSIFEIQIRQNESPPPNESPLRKKISPMIFDDDEIIIPTHPDDFKKKSSTNTLERDRLRTRDLHHNKIPCNYSNLFPDRQQNKNPKENDQNQEQNFKTNIQANRLKKFVIPKINPLHELIKENDSASNLLSHLTCFSESLNSLFESNFEQNLINLSEISAIKNSIDKWFIEHSDENINNQIIYSLFLNLIESMYAIDILFSKNKEDEMSIKGEYSSTINCLKMKNMRKSKECKFYKREMISSNSQIRLLKNKVQKLIIERDEVKKELHDIFKGNEPVQSFLNEIEENEKFGPQTLTESLIIELLKNYSIIPRRRRYSETIKSISFIIYSYSPIAFKTLGQFFPLPSEKTVKESFKSRIKETKNNLLNLSQLKIILDRLHEIYTSDKDEIIPSVLAVDAAAMRPNSDGKKAFIGYEIQPMKPEYKKKLFILKKIQMENLLMTF